MIINLLNIFVCIIGLCIGFIIGHNLFKKIIYKGSDSNVVKQEIHEDANGKFRWKPRVCICPISYSMFKLKDKNFVDEH